MDEEEERDYLVTLSFSVRLCLDPTIAPPDNETLRGIVSDLALNRWEASGDPQNQIAQDIDDIRLLDSTEGGPAVEPQWKDRCPSCGGALFVYQANGRFLDPPTRLTPDGFEVPENVRTGAGSSTEDERVRCVRCGNSYELEQLLLALFLFDLGDSTDGPVGLCIRAKGATPEAARARAVEILTDADWDVRPEDGAIQVFRYGDEYAVVHFNPEAIEPEDAQEPLP